jgi:excisionase family DNA binding protein
MPQGERRPQSAAQDEAMTLVEAEQDLAARGIPCSRYTLRRLADRGEIPVVRIGGRVWLFRGDFERWLRAGGSPPRHRKPDPAGAA